MKKYILSAVLATALLSCSKDAQLIDRSNAQDYELKRTGDTYTATFYKPGLNCLDVYFKGLKKETAFVGWRITGTGVWNNPTVVEKYFVIDSIKFRNLR